MRDIYLVLDGRASESRRSEADELALAVADAGLAATLAAPAEVPVDAVRLFWAEDATLAAIDPDEAQLWLDCAIAIDRDRSRLFDLLEARGLLGGLEYGEVGELRSSAGLVVRKDVVRHRGERVGSAPDSESDGYILWTDPDAASPAEDLASYLSIWCESDTELRVSAEEARDRKLPPVELRLKLGGTGLVRIPTAQAPGYYVVLSSGPGGGAGFFARPADQADDGLEQIARRMLQNPAGPPLQAAGGIERVRLAGKERESICLFSDWFDFRTASCAVRIEHARGVMMAIFACPMGARPPSCEAVLADPALRRIASSLRVADAEHGS